MGPAGPVGPQGETGPQGPTGATGMGIPAGGTVGQLMRKSAAADYATEWHTPALSDITSALGYTPPKPDGTGAAGTWGISISGNAATATSALAASWAGITGKPSTLDGYGITDAVNSNKLGAASGVATLDATGKVLATQLPAAYTLPTASASVLGGIKVGTGLAIAGDGKLSVSYSYTLTAATASALGGVKGFANLTVDAAGALSLTSGNVTAALGYTPAKTDGSNATGTWPVAISGNAASASAVAWGGIAGKPTTASGYGITDTLPNNARADIQNFTVKRRDLGNVSGTVSLDLALANQFSATATAATTFAFSNVPAGALASGVVLRLVNGGAYTITWPTAVKWPAGTAPTLTGSGTDVLVFLSDDNGTTWRGCISQKDSR